MSSQPVALLLCVLLSHMCLSSAKSFRAMMDGEMNWMYLDDFCFDWTKNESMAAGYLKWNIENLNIKPLPSDADAAAAADEFVLLLYDDQGFSWPIVRNIIGKDTDFCDTKLDLQAPTGAAISVLQMNEFANVSATQIMEHLRPRYWYIAVGFRDCKKRQVAFNIEFEFVNIGNAWDRQFGKDQQGMLGLYLFFTVFWLVFSVWWTHNLSLFEAEIGIPAVVQFYSVVVMLAIVHTLIQCLHFLLYARDGWGMPTMHYLGRIMGVALRLCLMFLVICLAQGFAIAVPLHTTDKEIIRQIFLVLTCCYIFLYVIWLSLVRNPWSTKYTYDTFPGAIIVIFQCLIWIYFMRWCLRVRNSYPAKRQFYNWFMILYSLWLLSLPFAALLALKLDPWVRFKIVHIFMYLSDASAICVMAYIMSPARMGKVFGDVHADFEDDNYMNVAESEEDARAQENYARSLGFSGFNTSAGIKDEEMEASVN